MCIRDSRSILEKASTAARAREAAKKARDLVIRKNAMEGGALPGKLADCSILTLAPGLGDSIQAMKGGILEVVDLILVNKSDNPEHSQTFHQLKSIIATAQFPDSKNIKIMATNVKDQNANTKIINYIENFVEKRMKLGKKKESSVWFIRQLLYEKIEKSLFDQKIREKLNQETFNEKDISEIVKRIIKDLR